MALWAAHLNPQLVDLPTELPHAPTPALAPFQQAVAVFTQEQPGSESVTLNVDQAGGHVL